MFLLLGTCLGKNQCGNNGTGPVCGLCPVTGVMTTQGCKQCPTDDVIEPLRNMAILIFSFVFLILWVWFSWTPFFPTLGAWMNRMAICCYQLHYTQSTFSRKVQTIHEKIMTAYQWATMIKLPQYFKIFVGFFQITSSFLALQVKWPGFFLNALMWLKATINFNLLSLPGISCLWKTIKYREKLLVYTISPLVFVALLGLPSLVIMSLKRLYRNDPIRCKELDRKLSATLDRFWNGVMFTAFMLYPMLSLITMEPFNCQPDGLGLLAADYRVPCPDPLSLERVWACVFIIFYPIGIPVCSILALRSMGVHRLANKKIESALVSTMINLYIQRTTSVESQKIAQLIGPVCNDGDEFKRRVRALFNLIWPDSTLDLDQSKDVKPLNIESRRLKFQILRAENLPKMDRFGSIDPYCTLNFAGRTERTSVKKNSRNPQWDTEHFVFDIESSLKIPTELAFKIDVMDWDQMGRNSLAGRTMISANDILSVVQAEPGYSKTFIMEVDVPSGTDVFEDTVSAGCNGCVPESKMAGLNKVELSSPRKFIIYVLVERLEGIVAGSELSKIKEFAMRYDTDQVDHLPLVYIEISFFITACYLLYLFRDQNETCLFQNGSVDIDEFEKMAKQVIEVNGMFTGAESGPAFLNSLTNKQLDSLIHHQWPDPTKAERGSGLDPLASVIKNIKSQGNERKTESKGKPEKRDKTHDGEEGLENSTQSRLRQVVAIGKKLRHQGMAKGPFNSGCFKFENSFYIFFGLLV
jgi:hypothetical protein